MQGQQEPSAYDPATMALPEYLQQQLSVRSLEGTCKDWLRYDC